MFSDDETKQFHGSIFMRPGDEIIRYIETKIEIQKFNIQEVCINEKFDKRDFGYRNEPLLSTAGRNGQDFTRYVGAGEQLFPDGDEGVQARFMWTEEDGTFAAMMDPGFGQEPCYGREAAGSGAKEVFAKDVPTAKRPGILPPDETYFSSLQPATSTSSTRSRLAPVSCKVDKSDPRSRFHFVKYLKRQGRTIKLWECGICGREFQHQYTLMRHLPTHTDERNFHCHACGKSFRQLSTLSQHRAIHSVERPYSCEVCSKNFNRVSTLISHRKTHSEDKPYKCHMCPKGFHQKGNLRNHLFTHTNERPYKCNLCEKGFNQQSNLVCHKNKAHHEDLSWRKIPKPRSASTGPRISRPKQPDVQPDSTSNLPAAASVSTPTASSSCIATATAGGVIVDAITTYHMGVALATRQMPFALLKPDQGIPVLVKVVDTELPGGKQMLVPATAEDLRNGGKIVMNDNNVPDNVHPKSASAVSPLSAGGGVQIRVPVVATVVPRARPGGGLLITVEEPHEAETHYHTAYDDGSAGRVPTLGGSRQVVRADSTVFQNMAPRCLVPFARTRNDDIKVGLSSSSMSPQPYRGGFYPARDRTMPALRERPPDRSAVTRGPLEGFVKVERFDDEVLNDLPGMESIASLLSSPGSSKGMCAGGNATGAAGTHFAEGAPPPFDLMSGCNHLDLFESIEFIPLGPQITAVHDVKDIPDSDESANFIGEYEELRVD